jgi:hypothetical protein
MRQERSERGVGYRTFGATLNAAVATVFTTSGLL